MPLLPNINLGQELYNARQQAYDDNIGYIIGWFKLMNIQPTANNLIANIDEIRAYIEAPDKKNHWEIDRVGTGIQWRFLIRAIGSVDENVIVDRVQLLEAGTVTTEKVNPFTGNLESTTGTVELYQEPLTGGNDAIFITSNGTYAIAANSINSLPFGGLSSVILDSSSVDAWFKGLNLQPNLALARKFSSNIFTYIRDARKEGYTEIVQGSFI